MTAPTPLFDEETPLEEEPAPTWPPDGRTGDDWWMIWMEDRPNTPMEQLLGEAVTYFTRKYGVSPTRALVPDGWGLLLVDAKGQSIHTLPQFPALKINTALTVQKGHVWLTHFPNEAQKEPEKYVFPPPQ